jgi:hypothetical protein
MIFGTQFAKKMGMLDSKPGKSMWQIYTVNGSVKEVFGESLDLTHLTSMKVLIKSFAYKSDV